jgi:hypothetical protein
MSLPSTAKTSKFVEGPRRRGRTSGRLSVLKRRPPGILATTIGSSREPRSTEPALGDLIHARIWVAGGFETECLGIVVAYGTNIPSNIDIIQVLYAGSPVVNSAPGKNEVQYSMRRWLVPDFDAINVLVRWKDCLPQRR